MKCHKSRLGPKHKLLLVELDLEMYTATQMVMARQVKLEAPDLNKLEKDFENKLGGKETTLGRKVRQTCF